MATYGAQQKAPSSLEGWIDRYNGVLKSKKKQIDSLNAQKRKVKDARRRAAIDASIDKVRKSMGWYQDEIASTQNKIYAREGQYEKLLKGSERDAYLAVSALFKSYGLTSLAPKIFDYVKNGYSGDTISTLLQDTKEYKARFAGNDARRKAGLPVLSPAEYLATEASYKQIMQQAGLPSGFYDQPADFDGWIGKNVSPSEVQTRVDLASQATTLANPNYRKALNQMGIKDSDLTAYFLDQKKALPHLQKAAATAAVGAAALGQGLTFDKSYAEQLALEGISADQAQQGYSNVAAELDTMKSLGAIYGEQWTQRTSEEAIFQGKAGALQKKGKLLAEERGAFSGAAGAARGGLSTGGGAR